MHVTSELLLTEAVLGIGAYIIVKRLFAAAVNASERIGDTLAAKFSRNRIESVSPPQPPASKLNKK
jgi:hypothetical protein